MDDPKFRKGEIDTNFMEYFLAKDRPKSETAAGRK
jgi:hypothetical protein